MRLGVLDIGSNTIHLLIADIRAGGRPIAATSERAVVRLMRYLDADGAISDEGVSAIVNAVKDARRILDAEAPDDFLATATSAIREAPNGPTVIALVEEALGRPLQVLEGTAEAELTFLAARRWFGWSAGQLLMLDIGGGSLEIAAGSEELPDVAHSLPVGAGRMTVAFLPTDPPAPEAIENLRHHVRSQLSTVTADFAGQPAPHHVVGSSKTIRSLARLGGNVRSGWAGSDRVTLRRDELGSWIPRLASLPADFRQILPGITADRTAQIVAGAVVLHEAMGALGVDKLEASPWALREGLLLRYIETRTTPAP